jgi:hypothetical protein
MAMLGIGRNGKMTGGHSTTSEPLSAKFVSKNPGYPWPGFLKTLGSLDGASPRWANVLDDRHNITAKKANNPLVLRMDSPYQFSSPGFVKFHGAI